MGGDSTRVDESSYAAANESNSAGHSLERLIEILALLRQHCPWMAALSHQSLIEYLVEECYELVDALQPAGNSQSNQLSGSQAVELRGELGDVLLQVVLHAQLQHEQGSFGMTEVIEALSTKMVRRNPHVFRPDGSLQDSFPATVQEIVAKWRDVKRTEQPERKNPFDGIPKQLPALALAAKTFSRIEAAGYPGDGNETAHFSTEEELGNVLLAVVHRAHSAGMDPERALRAAVHSLQQTTITSADSN